MRFILIFICIYSGLFSQTVRVCISEASSKVKITVQGVAVLYTEEGRYQLTASQNPFFVYERDGLIIFEGNGRFFKFKNTYDFFLQGRRSPVHVGDDFKESGKLEFHLSSENKVQIIAHVRIDRYLEHVLPNEIYTNKESYYEGIKAQCIAARTYTMNRLGQYTRFDMYADVRDQVYKSNIEVPEIVTRAVRETSREVVTYKEKLVDTKYSSTLGGIAEVPAYLSDGKPRVMVLENGTVLGKDSPYFTWTRSFTKDELLKRFNAWFSSKAILADSIDRHFSIEVVHRKVSGRIESVKLKLNENEVQLTLLDIRKFFHTDSKILPSNLFTISADKEQVVFRGFGNGHGEGLGQWETMDLSERGYNADQILSLFFPETEVGGLR